MIGAIHPMEMRPCPLRLRRARSAHRRWVGQGTGPPIGCHHLDWLLILWNCGRNGATFPRWRSGCRWEGRWWRPGHLRGGTHSGTTAATAATDGPDVADVSNAAPTPVLVDQTVLVVNVPTAVAHINLLAAGRVVALPAAPKNAVRCIVQRWGGPHVFLSSDVLLAGRRATSLPSSLRMLSVFAATLACAVAARAGAGDRLMGAARLGGWQVAHRQCAWDSDGRQVVTHLSNSGHLHCHFTRTWQPFSQ